VFIVADRVSIMPTTAHRSYHTDLKLAVQIGVVPETLLGSIPRSSRHRFVHSDYSKIYGAELSALFENMELMKEIAQSKAALKTATAVLRIASFVKALGLPFHEVTRVRSPELKKTVVSFVERISNLMPMDKALKLLGLPQRRFVAWKKGQKLCPSSPLDRCRKSYPNQLSLPELRSIGKFFRMPEFRSWPAVSIAWKLINDGIVCANVATITEYAKRLGLAVRKARKKVRTSGSVSATRPNEVWHLDATVITTESHEKAYLQFILDNYSRKILAWECASSISGLRTAKLLNQACASLPVSGAEHIDLIVDGGPENNNHVVSDFLDSTNISKLVARVDVRFSNNMIEAVNKIIKYDYIFRKPIPDLEHSVPAVAEAIGDYNDRPHYALRGVNPNRAYDGFVFDKTEYRKSLTEAKERRMAENRASCSPCMPFVLDNEEELG